MTLTDFNPIIETIEESYEIPHLNATRRISALLPFDYYTSNKNYPVIYLQDGQNLFNPMATYGDWAIDKSMAKLAENNKGDLIIIAINHGEHERINEYLPYFHPRFGEGKGNFYIQFMIEKLIPYVNKKYRTLTDFENTGIGGSSMGGLISLHAGLSNPGVFGKLMIFSPSLWISNKVYKNTKSFQPLAGSKIYLYAGGKESEEHLPNAKKLGSIISEKMINGYHIDFHFSINEEGNHSEIHWRKEFPEAIEWLFFKNNIE
jgi:predicted alpha/beta superfamily hydrolase